MNQTKRTTIDKADVPNTKNEIPTTTLSDFILILSITSEIFS